MASDFLVNAELEAADDLVKWLESNGFPVKAAFWALEEDSDGERWEFYVASERVGENIRPVLEEVLDLIDKAPNRDDLLEISRVNFVRPDHPFVRAISQVPLRGSRRPVHIRGAYADGAYVSNALVYRAEAA